MTAYNRIRKTITTNGNSLAVNLTSELKRMGLRRDDDVLITLERVDGTRVNAVKGTEALELLLDGHVLRSDDLNVRMAFDPMKVCTAVDMNAFAISAIEPTDAIPKDVWAATCPDLLLFLFMHDWSIETVNVKAINYNTRAYQALIRDAVREAGDRKNEPTVVQEIMHRLNDEGWEYDAKKDCGYIAN